MGLDELAPGLSLVRSRPAHAFNSYLLDDVLVDAATRWAARRLQRALRASTVRAHAITHAHADHQGASDALCRSLGLPYWVPAGEVAAAESGDVVPLAPRGAVTLAQARWWAGPGRPVDRALHEGDVVGGFEVLDTPGHSPGHVSFWRARDRVLVVGDVAFGAHPLTGRGGPREPPRAFTLDPARNRRSLARLAELRPALACFGHGPPLRDPGVLGELAARAGETEAKRPVGT